MVPWDNSPWGDSPWAGMGRFVPAYFNGTSLFGADVESRTFPMPGSTTYRKSSSATITPSYGRVIQLAA